MTEHYPYKDIEVHGTTWQTEIRQGGLFVATMRDTETQVHDHTWAEVVRKASDVAKARRKKIEVRFTVYDTVSYTMRSGTATSLHLGTGNPMVTWDGTSKSVQLVNRSYRDEYFPELSAEDQRRGVALIEARNKANLDWAAFRREMSGNRSEGQWSLSRAIQEALDAAPDKEE